MLTTYGILGSVESYKKEENDKLIEELKCISPIAWINMVLCGFYNFEEQPPQIDMVKLAEAVNMMKAV